MVIRRAHAGDAHLIAALVKRAYCAYIPVVGGRPAPMDADYQAKTTAGQVDVADDGSLVGLIVLVPSPGELLIENVAVDPASQGRGVGRLLMAHAEVVARSEGSSKLTLYTHRHLGYHEVARHLDDGFDRAFFEKPLAKAST
jgi:GNAT superfamily N-acetyltransferase